MSPVPSAPNLPTGRRPLADALPGLVALAVATALMWIEETADWILPADLDRYGIIPRDGDGVAGIVLAPFLHGGFAHLAANTVPLLVLGALAALRGTLRFAVATAVIVAVSGLGVWLTAPAHSVTIGASGVVFGYFGYVLARGAFDRRLLDIGVAAAVAVVYGSIIWGVLPGREGISWQGHLFGLIGGVLAAWILRRSRTSPVPRPPQ